MRVMGSRSTALGLLFVASCGSSEPSPPDGTVPVDTDLSTTDDTDGSTPADPTVVTSANGTTLALGGRVECEEPERRSQQAYTRSVRATPPHDGTEWPGLCPTQFDPMSEFSEVTSNSCVWIWAGGFIAADLDDDGFVDLVSPNEANEAIVYLGNAAGSFTEHVVEGVDLSHGVGGAAADYDGDGDLDVLVSRYAKPNVLLANEGGELVDVTAAAGIGCLVPDDYGNLVSPYTMSVSFGDYDHDADLDLFFGNYGYVDHALAEEENAKAFGPADPKCLYRNDGDGTFTDVTQELIPPEDSPFEKFHDGYTYVGGFFDFDNDLWPELYTVNDFGSTGFTNTVLWNRQGTFEPDPLDSRFLDVAITGMGLSVADRNFDLYPDLVMPSWNSIEVLESNVEVFDEPHWLKTPGGRGIELDEARDQKVGWGALAADIDNDALIDVLVAFGYMDDGDVHTWDNEVHQPDAVYMAQPNGTYVDEGIALGLDDDGVGRGFVVEDLNNDGWLDIAKRDLIGPNVFYLATCGAESWSRIKLRSPTANTHGVGARIEATVAGETQVRWVFAGGDSFSSGGSPDVHFGFGSAEAIDTLRVYWPDGVIDEFTAIPTRQILTITRR